MWITLFFYLLNSALPYRKDEVMHDGLKRLLRCSDLRRSADADVDDEEEGGDASAEGGTAQQSDHPSARILTLCAR
jgi:hypothetical protein